MSWATDKKNRTNNKLENKSTNLRKKSNSSSSLPAKRRKKAEIPYYQPKNALMHLNELKPGLKYTVEHSNGGSECESVFVVFVEVNGQKFFGRGLSKQSAKHAAAEAALKSFIQFRNMPAAMKIVGQDTIGIDFTEDNLEAEGTDFGKDEQGMKGEKAISIKGDSSLWLQQKINNKLRKIFAEVDKKNPSMLLHELRSELDYCIVQEGTESSDHKFIAEINVDGKIFNGVGQSKKAAKTAAARAILSQMYRFNFGMSQVLNEADKRIFDVPQLLADNIAKLIHHTFEMYAKKTLNCPQWRMLAGVVMTEDEKMETMQVICVSSGAKVLKRENLNFKGEVLNDCHAEVVARRCLKDFLFTQLELHASGKENQSIFQKNGNKFKLRPNVRFHFYVTSIPCGDATMFALHEIPKAVGMNLDSTDHGSGILRSKLEFGTIPVASASSEQTIEDIRCNQVKYQIMSCSDKITLWNVLGIQGSLLSYFIEPIYFYTVVFGRPFHGYHMLNCMFKRIEKSLKDIPLPFSLHKPKLACTTNWSVRSLLEVPKVSANWTYNQETLELIVSTVGKPREGSISRLAKRSLFQRFCKLQKFILKSLNIPQSQSYNKIKQECVEYCRAKNVAIEAFCSNGLGHWKKKPIELDMFEVTS